MINTGLNKMDNNTNPTREVLKLKVPVLTRHYRGVEYTIKRNDDGTWNYAIDAQATITLEDNVSTAGSAVFEVKKKIDKMKRSKR